MKKSKSELHDWPRHEYKRADFGKIVRGNMPAGFAPLLMLSCLILKLPELSQMTTRSMPPCAKS